MVRNLAWLLLAATPLAQAAEWTLRLDPHFVDVYGNDTHVLTTHEADTASTPATDRKTAFDLEMDRTLNFGFGLQRVDGNSGWGLDVFWYGVTAEKINLSATGTATTPVTYDASNQSYTSSAPADTVYYFLRDDNRLEVWTADLYYIRTLVSGASSALELQAGLRFGDFDNDYRSTMGLLDATPDGSLIDASSNYPRMMGPLVAFNGRLLQGRNRIEAYFGQSLIAGRASLTSSTEHFTGTPDSSTVDSRETFADFLQVAIPITELRLRYAYQLTEHLALGVGATTSAWWDVPTPPSVVPDPDAGADERLHENTVVFYSYLASIEWKF